MLDHIAPVDDSRGTLLHELVSAGHHLFIGYPAAATNEDRHIARQLYDAMVLGDVVARVGLNEVIFSRFPSTM
jgi:hypothetical protein